MLYDINKAYYKAFMILKKQFESHVKQLDYLVNG